MCQPVINRLASSGEEISKPDTRSDAAKMNGVALDLSAQPDIQDPVAPSIQPRRKTYVPFSHTHHTSHTYPRQSQDSI